MQLADLDYDLPREAIAQSPVEPRDAARLLVDRGPDAPPDDRVVADLPTLLGPGDAMVLNTTRVFPARLRLQKPTGGAVEVLLLEQTSGDTRRQRWDALVRPGRRVRTGTVLAAGHELSVTVGEEHEERGGGVRSIGLSAPDVDAALARHAGLALPPYLDHELEDPERYQTVYSRRERSVAAPTAGLHLTPAVLEAVATAGATVHPLELHVGPGTFRPVVAEDPDDHVMDGERYRVPEATLRACREAERVVAVGTTTVRAIETAARGPLEGVSELFIRPGHRFAVVDALLTNFHQPRSTLLALLCALIGPRWRDLYGHALGSGYRFLSLGDAMFLPARTG